ncbi:MAG: Hsp70 family protein, partial [Planctomycetota bacterium]
MKIKKSTPAVGIDLGTTFSVLCYLDEAKRPVTVVNAEGDRLTPSVVLFDEDEVVVGKEALKAYAVESDHVAECSKRDVGYRVYHKVLGGKHYPPEVIEAFILNKLRVDAQKQLGDFSHVVITVPAYFDEVRRKATQDAGYMAGLDVLDIINEPVAAALAFGHQQGLMDDDASTDRPQRILVYDLGGGTFDVTVMELRGRDFVTLAIDGDVHLGGWDWDQRLVDLVAERFIRKHYVDPREDSTAAGKLWRECEDAKRTLSARQKAIVPCECQGKIEQFEVTRAEFEEATQDLLDQTLFRTVQALKASGLTWNEIDRVLLVGGSTRMPMVRR